MKYRLYYGSKNGLDLPISLYSGCNGDFGQGVYFYSSIWHVIASSDEGMLYECSVDTAGLNVKVFGDNDLLEWACFIAYNLGLGVPEEFEGVFEKYNYDIIVGYLADENILSVIKEFAAGDVDVSVLLESIRRADMPMQVVCKTEKACDAAKVICGRSITEEEYEQAKAVEESQKWYGSTVIETVKMEYYDLTEDFKNPFTVHAESSTQFLDIIEKIKGEDLWRK